MESQIETHGLQRFEMPSNFTLLGNDRLIGSVRWLDSVGVQQERHYVLTVRDGKIADMQVCASWRQAKRFARR